ncbi:hypothetical protein [Candidatus Laterigemmans baculatus]|uniref:hypothetical protein n=1 Tax=Candidatus Laterigemmans baculatus TaxID=2770505 RepID=UPI0013DADB40|nr:hypothetical protein [Candidatus Laterigemmans baculatus]
MSPLPLVLILVGAAIQLLGVVFFAVIADSFQVLPLFVVISIGSAIEAAGVLTLLRRRG